MCILIKIIFKKEDHHLPSCSRVEKSRNYLWFLSFSPPIISTLRPNYFHILSSSWSNFATMILKQAPRTCPQLHTVPTGLLSNPAPNLFSFRTLKVIFFWKVFIKFVTMLFLFAVLVFWPRGMWDLSSPTRDGNCTPCIGKKSPNPWTTREVPKNDLLKRSLGAHKTLPLEWNTDCNSNPKAAWSEPCLPLQPQLALFHSLPWSLGFSLIIFLSFNTF